MKATSTPTSAAAINSSSGPMVPAPAVTSKPKVQSVLKRRPVQPSGISAVRPRAGLNKTEGLVQPPTQKMSCFGSSIPHQNLARTGAVPKRTFKPTFGGSTRPQPTTPGRRRSNGTTRAGIKLPVPVRRLTPPRCTTTARVASAKLQRSFIGKSSVAASSAPAFSPIIETSPWNVSCIPSARDYILSGYVHIAHKDLVPALTISKEDDERNVKELEEARKLIAELKKQIEAAKNSSSQQDRIILDTMLGIQGTNRRTEAVSEEKKEVDRELAEVKAAVLEACRRPHELESAQKSADEELKVKLEEEKQLKKTTTDQAVVLDSFKEEEEGREELRKRMKARIASMSRARQAKK